MTDPANLQAPASENIGPFDCPLHRNRVCSMLCPLFDADERDDGEKPEPSCLLTGAAQALINVDAALTLTPEEVEDGGAAGDGEDGDSPTVADLLSDVADALAGLQEHAEFVRGVMNAQLGLADGGSPPPPADPDSSAMKLLRS